MTEARQDKKPEYHGLKIIPHGDFFAARVMDKSQMDPGVTVESLQSASLVGSFNFNGIKGLHVMTEAVLKTNLDRAIADGHTHNARELGWLHHVVERKNKGLKPEKREDFEKTQARAAKQQRQMTAASA